MKIINKKKKYISFFPGMTFLVYVSILSITYQKCCCADKAVSSKVFSAMSGHYSCSVSVLNKKVSVKLSCDYLNCQKQFTENNFIFAVRSVLKGLEHPLFFFENYISQNLISRKLNSSLITIFLYRSPPKFLLNSAFLC